MRFNGRDDLSEFILILKSDVYKDINFPATKKLICFICGGPTFWKEKEFDKPICGEDCLNALWDRCPEGAKECK